MQAVSALRLGMVALGAVVLAVAGCVSTGQSSDQVEQAQAGGASQSLASFQRSLEQLRAGVSPLLKAAE